MIRKFANLFLLALPMYVYPKDVDIDITRYQSSIGHTAIVTTLNINGEISTIVQLRYSNEECVNEVFSVDNKPQLAVKWIDESTLKIVYPAGVKVNYDKSNESLECGGQTVKLVTEKNA